MRVAAIDIGTNSVLCLVAEKAPTLRALSDQARVTRLGQGVDATGHLSDEAVERTLACLTDYAATIRELKAERVEAVATSAMRDAKGGDAFLTRAEEILGCRPAVISGEREAQLSFDGALTGLDPEGKVAVFDVGGGSTEIIVGRRIPRTDATLHTAVSIDVGAVRLTERHITSDPPTLEEVEAIRHDVRAALKAAPKLDDLPLVAVAGTVTSLAAIAYEVHPYDGRRVHGALLSADLIDELLERLRGMTLEQRRDIAALDPRRADVIVAGATIVSEVCRYAGAPRVIVSDRGVRWGLARQLATAG